MRSIKFPKMFSQTETRVWKTNEYHEATVQNIKTLLQSHRGELIGDPYFGMKIREFMFNQNSPILADQISDIMYTQLALFIPQIHVNRSDINIIQDKVKGKLTCSFTAINQIDYQLDTYSLVLFDEMEES